MADLTPPSALIARDAIYGTGIAESAKDGFTPESPPLLPCRAELNDGFGVAEAHTRNRTSTPHVADPQ